MFVNRRRRRNNLPVGRSLVVGQPAVRRNRGFRSRNPMELRAMGSTMTNGDPDPSPVNSTIKVQHKIQIVVTSNATVNTPTPITIGNLATNVPGVSGWDTFRLMKVSAWGSDTANITVDMNSGSTVPSQGDAGVFTDWGTTGASRAALHIVPAFSQRQLWLVLSTSSTTPLFSFSSQTAGVICIFNLTVELQTLPVASPLLSNEVDSITRDARLLHLEVPSRRAGVKSTVY